jgi:hypothetical protein
MDRLVAKSAPWPAAGHKLAEEEPADQHLPVNATADPLSPPLSEEPTSEL